MALMTGHCSGGAREAGTRQRKRARTLSIRGRIADWRSRRNQAWANWLLPRRASSDQAPGPETYSGQEAAAIAKFFMKAVISFWSAKFIWPRRAGADREGRDGKGSIAGLEADQYGQAAQDLERDHQPGNERRERAGRSRPYSRQSRTARPGCRGRKTMNRIARKIAGDEKRGGVRGGHEIPR